MVKVCSRAISAVLVVVLATVHTFYSVAAAQIADTEPPVLIHRQAESAGVAGELQTFLARVSDDFDVSSVTLFYRQSESGDFNRLEMRPLLDTLGEYMIAVETAVTGYPAVQYYIEAVDPSGNKTNRGFSFAPIILPLKEPSAAPVDRQAPGPVTITQAPPAATTEQKLPGGLLIGVAGLLVLGLLAGSSGGGGSGSGGDTVTLTIISDGPTGN